MTKEEIIKETIEWYSVPGRRSKESSFVTDAPACKYLSENGNMCAVGRVLIPESLQKVKELQNTADLHTMAENFGDEIQVDHFYTYSIDKLLKEEYRGHEIEFWSSLQNLHDCDHHWTDKGLSFTGEGYVNNMCQLYNLSFVKIFPCKASEKINEIAQ